MATGSKSCGSRPVGSRTEATLTDIVAHEFGTDARFFTCSAENMRLPELLTFLAERDKVQLRDNLVFPGGSPACNHD